MIGILVIAQAATYVGVDEIDLDTAVGVLGDFVRASFERARAEELAAYGLGPVIGSRDQGVWPLAGCRPLSAAERAQAQQLVERWARPRIDATRTTPSVDLTASCWVGGEAVLAIDYWTTTPNDDGLGLYDEVLVLRGGRLRLVEQLVSADHTTGAFLDLTSAGDLDGDGKLDFVYMRPAGARREVVAMIGGKRLVIGSDDLDTCPRAVMVRTREARGIAAIVSDEVCGAPIGAGTDIAAWRVERGKLVADPANAHRLTEVSHRAERTLDAIRAMSCAAECTTPEPRPRRPKVAGPCVATDAMLADAVARLSAPPPVVEAVHVFERTRSTCKR